VQFSKKRWLIPDCEILLHSVSLLRGDLITIDIQYKIPYKDTEGVEFASNFLQIEIRNVCRLFYLS
jgi:hypothetical protein